MKENKNIAAFIPVVLAIIANIVIIAACIIAFKYVGLYKALIYSCLGIIFCIVLIVDIVTFVSFRYKMKITRIIAAVMSVVLLIGGGIGTFYLLKVDAAMGNLIDEGDETQYETIHSVVAVYDNDTIDDISKLNGKKIGSLSTNGISAASICKNKLNEEGISASYKEYNTVSDLYSALLGGEVDAAIFSNSYRTQLSSDDSAFEELLEKTKDIYKYDEKVKTSDEETSRKNLSSEPFSVLLIGYAPEPGGGGLTDTIILATVNPQSMAVTMTSIPRDSYVPISCYGGNRSKINDAGANSNACLMETVEDLMDVDIDFYMKVNFQGIVDIVDALGGIYINSPISFVGQTPSDDRGMYTVWVPAGPYTANGEQALAFARERHHMPNGDFDRQIHQQQVISEIAKKLIEMKDVNAALAVLEAAGENFSTNISLNQLTEVFNYIISAPNYTERSQFQIINIKSTRLTGYTYWFYSYSAQLPLWSLYLYNGSIKENGALAKDNLNIFPSIDQEKSIRFFGIYPYYRDPYFHESFAEPRVPENMPAYYPHLTDLTYEEAKSWAAKNGVTMSYVFINEGDPGYNANKVGSVISQSVKYGRLVSQNPSCTITVMGMPIPDEDRVPNFVGKSLSDFKSWANSKSLNNSANAIENTDPAKAGIIKSQSAEAGRDYHDYAEISVEYYDYPVISTKDLQIGMKKTDALNWANNNLINVVEQYRYDANEEDVLLEHNCGDSIKMGSTCTMTFSTKQHDHKWKFSHHKVEATETSEGIDIYVCDLCGVEEERKVPKLEPATPPSPPDDQGGDEGDGGGESGGDDSGGEDAGGEGE